MAPVLVVVEDLVLHREPDPGTAVEIVEKVWWGDRGTKWWFIQMYYCNKAAFNVVYCASLCTFYSIHYISKRKTNINCTISKKLCILKMHTKVKVVKRPALLVKSQILLESWCIKHSSKTVLFLPGISLPEPGFHLFYTIWKWQCFQNAPGKWIYKWHQILRSIVASIVNQKWPGGLERWSWYMYPSSETSESRFGEWVNMAPAALCFAGVCRSLLVGMNVFIPDNPYLFQKLDLLSKFGLFM